MPDFERAANDYTAETISFNAERVLLDKSSRVLEGFRIQIDALPGQITVYNGNALDRAGEHVTEEASAVSSITLTLTGVSTTFYLEVERVEAESDSDSRGFWDPVYDNPTDPDGRDFPLTVATRETPTWRIVQPVSTTGFQSTSDPNSVRIPLAILSTDGSNEITAAATPGLVTVYPSTVLEKPVSIGATSMTVVDARLFATSDTITVDLGGTSPEAGLTISAVDPENGIISFAPALAAPHETGAIVRRTSGTAFLVEEKTDPTDPAAHPDYTPRMWQGDEARGRAFVTSKETFGERDDLNVRNLKDKLDQHDALFRELKFGSFDPATISAAPPSSFATRPRYFDSAGSVQGARMPTVSIGDGTNSFGDFNGTDETPFEDAVTALPATGGLIFVKAGAYTFSTGVSIAKAVRIVGESRDVVTITNNDAVNPLFTVGSLSVPAGELFSLEDIRLSTGTGTDTLLILDDLEARFNNAYIDGGIEINGSVELEVISCEIKPQSATPVVSVPTGSVLSYSYFTDSQLVSATGPIIQGFMSNSTFVGCVVFGANFWDTNSVAGIPNNVSVTNCIMDTSSTAFILDVISGAAYIFVSNCYFVTDASPTVSGLLELNSALTQAYDISFSNCTVFCDASGTTLGTPTNVVSVEALSVKNITFSGCNFYALTAGQYLRGIQLNTGANDCENVQVNGCHFQGFFEGVNVTDSNETTLFVKSCLFNGDSAALTEQYGVRFEGECDTHAIIEGCSFTGMNAATSIGIYVDGLTGADAFHANISNNLFWRFDTPANASYISFASGSKKITANIGGNTLADLGASSTASGINMTVASTSNVTITNNVIDGFAGTGTATIRGIFINTEFNLTITGNTIANLSSPLTSVVYGIDATGLSGVISGNRFSNISSASVGSVSAHLHMTSFNNVVISGNSFVAEASNTPYLIRFEGGAFGYYNLAITGNSLDLSPAIVRGISIENDPSGACYGLSISQNTLTVDAASGSVLYGIRVEGGVGSEGVALSGNTINESTFDGGWLAISANDCLGIKINDNMINGVIGASGARAFGAINLADSAYFTINSNVVRWVNGATVTGPSIVGGASLYGTINGNVVKPGNLQPEINMGGTSDDLVVNSNIVGNSVDGAGTLVPSTTAGNNVVADNKIS